MLPNPIVKLNLTWLFLKYVPRNLLSTLIGWFVRLNHPKWLAQALIRKFTDHYNIKVEEAELPLSQYRSLGLFFVRRLKKGARTIQSWIIHPVDAFLTEWGQILEGKLVQAKLKKFGLSSLLAFDKNWTLFENGHFFTYYLCPTDYHRVHSPVTGVITRVVHVPGHLWPVNEVSVSRVDNLFSLNERVIVFIKTEIGNVAVVLVGATNVGKISLVFDKSVVTNQLSLLNFKNWFGQYDEKDILRKSYEPGLPIKCGDELGVFNMGSTVILLLDQNYKVSDRGSYQGKVQLGEGLKVLNE